MRLFPLARSLTVAARRGESPATAREGAAFGDQRGRSPSVARRGRSGEQIERSLGVDEPEAIER